MINSTPLEELYGHLGLVVLVIPKFIGSCVERWYFLSLCMVSLIFRCESVFVCRVLVVCFAVKISVFEQNENCERYTCK